jgi:serine/threonine protein kinase
MPPPTFATGHLLVNRYRISELLGVGQTAEVYLAEDTSLQRSVTPTWPASTTVARSRVRYS